MGTAVMPGTRRSGILTEKSERFRRICKPAVLEKVFLRFRITVRVALVYIPCVCVNGYDNEVSILPPSEMHGIESPKHKCAEDGLGSDNS